MVLHGLILQSSSVPRCWASTLLTHLLDGASTACRVPQNFLPWDSLYADLLSVACNIRKKERKEGAREALKRNNLQPGHQACFFSGGFGDLLSLRADAGNFMTNPQNMKRART